jgi:uncharacterized phage-associated protein
VGTQYDRTKLAELILHLAERGLCDPYMGKTKLAKLLYFSDFAAYLQLGAPITGATYVKYPRGPLPRDFYEVLKSLEDAGALVKHHTPMGTYVQHRYVALRSPDLSQFSGEEIALVDRVVEQFAGLDASTLSTRSHMEAGWLSAEDYDEIPYEMAFVSTDPPSDRVVQVGLEVAARHGLLAS